MGKDLTRADSQEKTTTAKFAELPREAQPSEVSSYHQDSFKTLRSFYSSLKEMRFLQRAKDLVVDVVAVDFELTSDDFADGDWERKRENLTNFHSIDFDFIFKHSSYEMRSHTYFLSKRNVQFIFNFFSPGQSHFICVQLQELIFLELHATGMSKLCKLQVAILQSISPFVKLTLRGTSSKWTWGGRKRERGGLGVRRREEG